MNIFDETFRELQNELRPHCPADTSSYQGTGESVLADEEIRQKAAQALLNSFPKKFVGESKLVPCVAYVDRVSNARDKFLAANSVCESSNKVFGQSSRLEGNLANYVLAEARRLIGDLLFDLNTLFESDPASVLSLGMVGPGVATDAQFNDIVSKLFDSPLGYPTEEALRLWYCLLARDPSLQEAERVRASKHGCPTPEFVAKWSTAPKNNETERSINIGASLTSFGSRAIGLHLEAALLRGWGVNFVDQPEKNRCLAMLGSLDVLRDHPFRPATIDLVDASNLIFLLLVRYLFGDVPYVLHAMEAFRDQQTRLGDQLVKLQMFSTMGNGYTFPMQTIVFTALAKALYLLKNEPEKVTLCAMEVRMPAVFGDDIIIPESMYSEMLAVLQALHMQPNLSKSFGSGPFKESCGTDWYRGQNIRGVYVKKLDKPHHAMGLFNSLAAWSGAWDIPIPLTLVRLLKWIKEHDPVLASTYVPMWEDPCSGIQTPSRVVKDFGLLKCEQNISKTVRIEIGAQPGSWIYHPFRPQKRSRVIGRTCKQKRTLVNVRENDFFSIVEKSNLDDVGFIQWLEYPTSYKTDGTPKDAKLKQFEFYNLHAFTLLKSSGLIEGDRLGLRLEDPDYNQSSFTWTYAWDMPTYEVEYDPNIGWSVCDPTLNFCQPRKTVGWPERTAKRIGVLWRVLIQFRLS